MPDHKPKTGPMRTQPIEHASNVATPVPMRPIDRNSKKALLPKEKLTRSEAVRATKARMTRLNSLRKQREALKGTFGS
jgi:hypothetical protein